MIPARPNLKAKAIAYKLLENGELKEIWSIADIPSLEKWDLTRPQYILDDDGNTLVIWQYDWDASNNEKTALRVFNRGKLARAYSTSDFVKHDFMKTVRGGPCGESPSWLVYDRNPPHRSVSLVKTGYDGHTRAISFKTPNNLSWQIGLYKKPVSFPAVDKDGYFKGTN
jgi:hypothetical protein